MVFRLYEVKVYVSTQLGVMSKKVAEIECCTGEGIPLGAPTGIKGAFSGDSYVHKAGSVRRLKHELLSVVSFYPLPSPTCPRVVMPRPAPSLETDARGLNIADAVRVLRLNAPD